MVKGQAFLKVGGGWHFPIYFFQVLSFLHLKINFMRKGNSKLPKKEPENIP